MDQLMGEGGSKNTYCKGLQGPEASTKDKAATCGTIFSQKDAMCVENPRSSPPLVRDSTQGVLDSPHVQKTCRVVG